jgi:hypothetical protein
MKLSDWELYEECRAAGLRVHYSAEQGKVVIDVASKEEAHVFVDIAMRIYNFIPQLHEECREAGLRVHHSAEQGKVVVDTTTPEDAQDYVDIACYILGKYNSV